MNKLQLNRLSLAAAMLVMVAVFLSSSYGRSPVAAQVGAKDYTYTTDADFDLGTLVSVNHDWPNNDQLQLDSPTEPFPFINIAASGRGTVVRAHTESGEIVGEYRTAPEGRGLNPSRTTVDLFGNVWTANRDEVDLIDGVPHGSAVKIGLIVGGTRVDAAGTPDPGGGYLKPPYAYNTCTDRDGDDLIRTSMGLGDVLDWPDISDGLGGADGLVEDAVDECILIYQRLYDAEQARHVSVDADNNVWVGGYPFEQRMFYKLAGADGAILDSFDSRAVGCGGYGGLIDGNGVLWSVGGPLLRYDPATGTGMCIEQYGYGLGIDTNGYLWLSLWEGGIVKIAPDGTVVPGFPKHTFPPSMTMTTAASLAAAPEPAPAAAPVASFARAAAPAEAMAALDVVQAIGDPTFRVAVGEEWLQSLGAWTPGAPVNLTVEDGSGIVYSASTTAGGDGSFSFGWQGSFDMKRGQDVTVSDGVTTKTHTVLDLFVDEVDLTNDTISGRADAGTSVDIWVHGDGGLTVTADGDGNWTADFSGITDLDWFSSGGCHQLDDDGDATGVWWAAPAIQAAPDDKWVSSDGTWTPDATASLSIEDGGVEVYSDTQTIDVDGRFFFNLWDVFNLQRGQVVAVSDGTQSKTHTIMDLYVYGMDVTADTVFGTADPDTVVETWVHGDGNVDVTAGGSGNWTASYLGLTDLTYFSDGGTKQYDADVDSTRVWWDAPKIEAAPDDDWVQSWGRWRPGATVTLTIADGTGPLYSDWQVVNQWSGFHFSLQGLFDLQRGHLVTVSDGYNTKTMRVADLYVDSVNTTNDTVSGRAPDGDSIRVWVHGDGYLETTAYGSGNWIADFSSMTDITYASDGGSILVNDQNDSTFVGWSSPKIEAAPDDNWVQSWSRWTPGATVTLTIKDGPDVVHADSTTVDGNGYFFFPLWNVFDLQRGHIVTVSDGKHTKTLTVAQLYVDGVDITGDTVSGRAPAGTEVQVWVHGDGELTTTSGGGGNWTADFSGMTDLTYASDGGSRQVDDDGDSTGVWWASPSIMAAPDDNWVESWNRWPSGASISLTIEDDSGVVHSDSMTADDSGYFHFGLGSFDLQRGHVVTVSDGATTKDLEVADLFVDGVDVGADRVYGRALDGGTVHVWVHGDGEATATADLSGNWTANFLGQVDLTYLSDGGSRLADDDGDYTGVWWASPCFRVSPQDNWVQSWRRWPAGATITVDIDDGAGGTYSTSQVADTYGNFHIDLGGFGLASGYLVTVSDGTTTKTHIINDVAVTNIDKTLDLVSGTANAGATVQVWVGLFDDGSNRWVTADIGGNWTADFAVPTADQPVYDITGVTRVNVDEFDDDGDATYRRFGPPSQWNRGVAVTPIDNNVWVANSGVNTVTRLDNDGNVLAVFETGQEPTGVAVDAAGKVWATNMGHNTAVRIDPNAGPDGLGAIDLTVDLGQDAWPYNYSDMTGAVVVGSTSPQGFWTVIQDGGQAGLEWGRINWNDEPEGYVPEGGTIVVEARAADTEAGLGGQPFVPVEDDVLFSLFGRYIEVRVTLKASPDYQSPVLSDLRVRPASIVDIDIKPGSDPNTINCANKKETITVAILTTAGFNALEVDHTTVFFEGAQEYHMVRGVMARHEEDVDLDGDMDLVIHVRLKDTDLTCDSTEGWLTGRTYSGYDIEGVDLVRMIIM